jgi:virulence-associated protein VapD
MANTNNTYTNIKDILKQFELQVVQKKHYTKDEVYTQVQTTDAISAAIAGVNQFNIVKSSSATNTPKGVEWTSGSTTIKGTLEAKDADRHTIYYVPSDNGTNDNYDEYMALVTGTNTYAWEKIGNTDIDLKNYSTLEETVSSINFDNTDGLYYIYANEHIATDKHKLGTAANWRTFLGATDTASNTSAGLATPKMVYNLQEKPVSSDSEHGITLGGTVKAPTISVDTTDDIGPGGSKVVIAAQVYNFAQPKNEDLTAIAALTGTNGLLKKTDTNTWELDDSTYATRSESIGIISFSSSKGLRSQYASKAGSAADADWNVIASVNTLKSGLGINDKADKSTTISSTNYGVKLGGTIGSPTITVEEGSISAGSGKVVAGGTVYNYISGSSGVLYMSDTDFSDILANV